MNVTFYGETVFDDLIKDSEMGNLSRWAPKGIPCSHKREAEGDPTTEERAL